MHRFLKTLLPLCILSGSACINVPDIEQPDAGTTPDTGGFTLSVDPAQANVPPGGSQNIQLSLSRLNGFTDSVTLSLLTPPAGISASPVTIAAGSTSATLSISVSASTEPGPKTLTVRGTAGTLTQDATMSLTVTRPGELLVSWAGPSQSKVYVKDSVQMQVVVEGGTADTVDLYKGTTFLTRLSAPSFQYTWDTTQETEGEYQLTARATRAGATFTSSARTFVVDRTAPKVATRTPAPGATTVSVRDTLQVNFDEALRASSVTDSSVVLAQGTANIAKTLSLSTDGKTLTITPSAPLTLPANVSITLGTGTAPLLDLAGNTLAASSAWNFTVPAWLPLGGAISAVDGATPAENVSMKVGTDGNPVIAWSESDGSSKNIYVRRWTGTNWVDFGPPLSAVPGAGFDANEPDLLLDTVNRPTLVWEEKTYTSGGSDLYGSRWTGTTWASLPAILPAIHQEQGSRASGGIAFDNAGNLIVTPLYYEGVSYVQVFRLASNSWEPLTEPQGGAFASNSDLAIDVSGHWFIAYSAHWETGSDLYHAIYAHKRDIYGNWTQLGDPVLSPAKGRTGSPSLALNGNGRPIIAWEESNSSDSNVYAAIWNGSSWQMVGSMVNSSSTTSNTRPALVMDHDGQPMVAWSGYVAPETSIWVSRWDGSNWKQVGSRLSAANGVATSGFRPALGLDKNGQPLVAWHESDGAVTNIHVHRYNY
jgi:hypothetical protein